MNSPPLVSIIVITMNTPRMTAACLRSVVRNSSVPYELIVINNSRARAIRRCLREFPSARVIQNPENFGFSRAANQGIVAARGQYLCLLNTDTLVPPQWLERLLEALRKPGVAAVGPASDELYKLRGRSQGKPWPLPFLPDDEAKTALADKLLRQRNRRKKQEVVPFLHGFCLLLSRVAMAATGPFDEGYFFGLEDIDYCLQLRIRGYQLLRVHSLFVHHRQGASSKPERRRQLVEWAEDHFLKKWTTPLNRTGIDFPALLRQLNNQIPLRQQMPEPASFRPPPNTTAPRRLVRRGFLAQALNQTALVRFSDLDVFISSASTNRIWNSLRGGLDLEQFRRTRSRLLRQQVEGMLQRDLIREIRPNKPARCRVTVMMAAHQAEPWIDQAIESVLAQEFQDFEVIIVDDGSLDGTSRVIQQYAWHPKIRFVSNPLQKGIPATRNRILREAKGKYIAVCDADDIMLPGCLQRFVRILEQNPRVGWVYGDRMGIRSQGLLQTVFQARPPNGKTEFQFNVISHAGALIRREAMEAVGGYEESLLSTEDYDLALKIARQWKIVALRGQMQYLWRQHWESASRTNPWARQETERLLKEAKKARFPEPKNGAGQGKRS